MHLVKPHRQYAWLLRGLGREERFDIIGLRSSQHRIRLRIMIRRMMSGTSAPGTEARPAAHSSLRPRRGPGTFVLVGAEPLVAAMRRSPAQSPRPPSERRQQAVPSWAPWPRAQGRSRPGPGPLEIQRPAQPPREIGPVPQQAAITAPTPVWASFGAGAAAREAQREADHSPGADRPYRLWEGWDKGHEQ